MVEMIAYCAADTKYFELYFELWATQMNRYYPEMKKIIAVHNPDQSIAQTCNDHGVELRNANVADNPVRAHFYLMRWANLPYDTNDLILETQINCLPIKTQLFGSTQNVDHLRIVRPKRQTTGGLSAAVFKPEAAKRIVEQANRMLKDPPDGDHQINQWQATNLSWSKVLAEQQFKSTSGAIEPWCNWITSGTSQHYSAEHKIKILKHYLEDIK